MEKNEWVCTDINCNQYVRKLSDTKFEFKEDRLFDPVTKETRTYQSIIDLSDYEDDELFDACDTFGYDKETVLDWIVFDTDIEIIAECLFELEEDPENYI